MEGIKTQGVPLDTRFLAERRRFLIQTTSGKNNNGLYKAREWTCWFGFLPEICGQYNSLAMLTKQKYEWDSIWDKSSSRKSGNMVVEPETHY